jgi:hypothetical protein
MTEAQMWQSGYRDGVRLARSVARGRFHHSRRSRSRPVKIPPGAHVETFGEAIRWGEPFLDWGKIWRWLTRGGTTAIW